MNHLEIERKWLIKEIPIEIINNLNKYIHYEIEQVYIATIPSIRIRRQNNDYILNIKSTIENNDLIRHESEINITKFQYDELYKNKIGIAIKKDRYVIPISNNLNIELDIFKNDYKGLIYAEIEFLNDIDAKKFIKLDWFYKELTGKKEYNNSSLSLNKISVNEIYNI